MDLKQEIRLLSEQYGESWYVLDTKVLKQNYAGLLGAFTAIYPKTRLSYSYKTNYMPRICGFLKELGAYAEVVSDMEYRLALQVGVQPEKIIFNGPCKDEKAVEDLLLSGGLVNIDAQYELEMVLQLAARFPEARMRVGLRCNFDIGDGVVSRFGWDVDDPSFEQALVVLRNTPGLKFCGLHCHFSTRTLDTYKARTERMMDLIDRFFETAPEYISLGGGFFGKMDESLARQFEVPVPSFAEYAGVIATAFRARYKGKPWREQPALFLEPGSSLVANVLNYYAKVVNIKSVRGKDIATVAGSLFNINPRAKRLNPYMRVVAIQGGGRLYQDLDIGGYTCVESDYLFSHYEGPLQVGDFVVFGNVGSYSLSFKPPFIWPNVPVVESVNGRFVEMKRQEELSDILVTYKLC